ncbi:PREDICTED: uncharacterized protein LOC107327768 isoform X9 [Acropora digitifera]|uniref:uncharacterized protein LOC107327768 isoform X9 n=1 Tax=Acropora digitifera TaxID=70779 RepID=UPI00077A535B|nr:PREDICTED: uncharacterized protein LOC107327768 isoform X9 [Acropora digitifera]
MCGNVAFLAVLVWFFSAESRSDTFLSKITRDYLDSFTNDFCGPCSKREATPSGNSSCTCSGSIQCLTNKNGMPQGSVYVRSEGKCESSCKLKSSNKCFYWGQFEPLIVLDLQDLTSTHEFHKEVAYLSCKWGETIAYLDASGNWEQVSLSANAFQVLPVNGQELMRNPSIKVNQRSASLTKLGGHIMKLGLNCTRRDNNQIIRKCLVFKSKGKLNFTLCNYTATTTTSPPPPSSSTTTVNSTVTPSNITTTTPPGGDMYPLIVALLTLLAVCVTLGASVMCFCYFKRGSNWNLHRRERRDFADNQNEQTYIKQEDQEPVYVELPEVLPVDSNSSDTSSAVAAERKQCTEDEVIVNPYVNGALFTIGRSPTSDPLPRKPIQRGNTPTQEPTCNLNVTDGQDKSIVLKNPRVRESSVGSPSMLRSNVDNLTTPREDEDKVVKLRHPHSRETDEDNFDYQGLAEQTRVKSLFVCPCCEKNVHYQRLSTPDQCECERKDRPSQKRQSIYESLSHERGKRESLYASPLRASKEIEGSRNMEQSPEYHTLESDEIDSSQEPVDQVYPDYNELEEPEQTCCEADEDNNKSSRLSQHADGDSEIPRKLLEIIHADDNPVYTFACKEKKEKSKVYTRERSRSI